MDKLSLGYLRVSTDRQDLSLEAQTSALKRAAEYHQAGEISLFAEPDTSGSTEFAKREQGKELLERAQEYIAAGIQVTILVTKVDRLGRDVIDINQTVRLFERMGARVIFLDLNVDTSTAMGRAFMQIAAVFAELELARIRERIQTALNQKRSHGMLTGSVPFGWDAVLTGRVSEKDVAERKLVDNPAEQQWILTAINWRSAGWNSYQIAKEFNLQGVRTKNGGKNWQSVQIDKMLDSKTVREWFQHRQDFSQPTDTETATDPELIQAL
jgi:DNA invertase Pin-like site-specific DNA recombinase